MRIYPQSSALNNDVVMGQLRLKGLVSSNKPETLLLFMDVTYPVPLAEMTCSSHYRWWERQSCGYKKNLI